MGDEVSGAEIVPFGKYKGQPLEVMVADTDYCEWLVAQPWFSAKYRNVYNVVINYGGEPQDSPEHNQMQARFLEADWCFRLADLLRPGRIGSYGDRSAQALLDSDPIYRQFRQCVELEPSPAAALGPRFEDRGWDVTYGIDPASISTHRMSLVPPLPACTCRCDDHSGCPDYATCQGGVHAWGCGHSSCEGGKRKRDIDRSSHCISTCYWRDGGELTEDQRKWLKQPEHFYQSHYQGKFLVELKPDLGDDYPSVLRQVKGYPGDDYDDKRCVVVRRHAFQHVTWEQVQKIFATSQVTLIAETDIEAVDRHAAEDPERLAMALIEQELGAEAIDPWSAS